MSPGSHASPAEPAGTDLSAPGRRWWAPRRWSRGSRHSAWSIGTPLMVLASGALFVVSAESSEGTDLRPGRYTDLASLVRAESRKYEALQERVAELNADVELLSAAVGDRTVNRYRRDIAVLRDPAGLTPRIGPGVTVTLTDAPNELVLDALAEGRELNDLVVHQQDIQAAVNALWKGGASAVTIQGQRVVSTTGIKCVGNSVTLHGRPYSPPYVIKGVGDPDALVASIESDRYLREYREDAAQPDIAIGWDLVEEDRIVAPAYEGLLDLTYARPVEP